MNHQQQAHLNSLCPRVHWHVDMSNYSTFRVGGKVEAMVEITDPDALADLVRWLHTERIPWQVLGGGSNILIRDVFHEGVFIRLCSGSDNVRLLAGTGDTQKNCSIEAWAGTPLASLVSWCTRNGLGGMELLAGIPGTVGGAVRMNAGALGQNISSTLDAVRVVDSQGMLRDYARNEIRFGYRQSFFPGEPEKIILARASFTLQPADATLLAECNRKALEQRKQSQPQGFASAGSFFKNPEGDFAGRLIEQAGLKGLRQGNAMVSPKHANFIVNTGNARPDDIVELMRQVQEKVLQHSGILLEPEVHIF